mmetsp:Transcript_5039/g.12027  ORF Transcript_5039/g.12027 Transcript_5039/m.12027 type:complete len:1217 (-) Transcript_5039:2701-6351(-)|eukprot:CAMPEP_0113618124 /NCGR_PEP_ID=MMETSP0017_2-20120614/9166_1 /TAXON_ID=2856 /ORGANISM="Cylindrotheca closterium" /LENGTH=1216 /DNA_ID=CAMNT_0000527605 /DNA_START=161 /DNA_END=3811 /DNA_ORIENTATION=- /assembly_acc=CAM_ASM_000147
MVLTSLSLDYVVSDEKHYGPFVCGICKGLCSLDVVVTPNDNLYCRECLKNYLQKTISQDGRALDPVSKVDLKESDENDTMMVVESVPIRAKSLKIAQSLAYMLLMNVQVKGTPKGSKQEWVGDYKDYHKQLNGLLEPSRIPSIPKPSKPTRGTSVERPSVYEDDLSRAGTTVRGEPTAAHHLRSMPQHADAGSVNLPDIERAMGRCDKLKKQANAKFNRGDIEGARMLYSEGLALISDLPIANDTVRIMMASLYSNRAVTFFRERILPQSLEDCNKSLELDGNAEKTYIRKWRTLSAMDERDEGIACLHIGLERLPDSHKLQDELRKAMAPVSSFSKMDNKQSDDFSVSEMTKMTTPVGGYDLPTVGGGDPSPAAIERSDRLKKQANAKFNKGEIESARQLYSDAIGCIPPGGKYSQEIKTSLSMLYSNRAVTFFRDKMYRESLSDCEKAIDFDPTAEKGYIRKARALIGLERMQEAFDSLQEGRKELPNSKKIAEELRKSEFDGLTPSAPAPKKIPAQKRLSNDHGRPASQSELESSVGSFNYFVSPDASKTAATKIKKGADEDFSYELELSDKLKRNANAKFNRGDITGARLLYTEALGCLPDDTGNEKVRSTLAALYANRAVTFFREKEFGPSTWDCDKAIELDPKSEKSYIRKARALTALSRYDDAIDCLEKGLTVLPASSRLKDELAKCQENGGDYHESRMELSVTSGIDYMSVSSMGNNTTGFLLTPKDARSVLGSVAEGSALEVPFSGDEDVERAEKLKKQANAKLNKGDVAGARELYGQGLEYLPKNTDNRETRELAASLYANRAVTFFREKKFAATVLDCDKSLELDAKHEKSYIRKWRALMALGSFHDAYKCLEDALVAIPGSKRLEEELEAATEQRDLLNNANELIENGDYEGARDAMLPIVNSTDNVSLWLAAARADAYLGITDSALERVNKVLMFNPNHLEGLQVRGYALFLSGEMEQGMSILKESLEVDIDNTEVSTLLQNCQKIYSNFSKGQARVKRGRYREAVELFTTALESSDTIPIDAPLYSLMLTERAEASLLNHDYEDALEDCGEAIDLKQDNVTAWTVKVEVYFAQGRLQDARDELAEARKSWGAGNDTIEDAYKKTDFELRLQRADDDLRKIAAAVDIGEIPDVPDGEPLHFNIENMPKPSKPKSSRREKSVERRDKSVERREKSKKSSGDRKEHKRKKRSSSSNRRPKSTDKQ